MSVELTQPYINSVGAFDPTQPQTMYLNVLGGSPIDAFTYRLYNNSGTALGDATIIPVTNDIESDEVRTFAFVIPANTITTSNATYKIQAYTSAIDDGVTYNSALSSFVVFNVHETPSLQFWYTPVGSVTQSQLTANTTIYAESFDFTLKFITVDANTTAKLSIANVSLLGKRVGQYFEVWNSGNIYFNNLTDTIYNFSQTTTSETQGIYDSYRIVITGTTQDNMVFSNTIDNLTCSISSSSATQYITASNQPNDGTILVNCTIPTLSAVTQFISYFKIQVKETSATEWISLQTIYATANGSFPPNVSLVDPYEGNNRSYIYRLAFYGTTATAKYNSATSSDLSINAATFFTTVGTTAQAQYTFTYNGTNWTYSSLAVTLSTYGITYSGTPSINDIITVNTSGANNLVNSYLSDPVASAFCGAFICDATHIYKLTNEWTESNNAKNQKVSIYEPYGSQFPFVAYNALTNYYSGTTQAILIAPTSAVGAYVDGMAQSQLGDEFDNFATNKKPKILKDFNGNVRLIAVTSNVTRNNYKELGNALFSTVFSWVEIGSIDEDTMSKFGMQDGFDYSGTYNISITAINCQGKSDNATQMKSGQTVILYFKANSGYNLPSIISVSNATFSWDNNQTGDWKGKLIISSPTNNVTATIDAS